MQYSVLADTYQDLEATTKNLEMESILADLFQQAEPDELEMLGRLAMGRPFPAHSPVDIGIAEKMMIKALTKSTGHSEEAINDLWREHGDLGDVTQNLLQDRKQATLTQHTLTVEHVHNTIQDIAHITGEGSQEKKLDMIAELLSNASPLEGKYIVRTILETLRIGVGEGTIRNAIAEAFTLEPETVQQAYDIANDMGRVARIAKEHGQTGLEDLSIEVGRPLNVMLAKTADDVEDAFDTVANETGEVLAQYKYDGLRVSIHHKDGDVKVFTRRLEDVTAQFPDIVDAVKKHCDTSTDFIIEGEAVAYNPETGDLVPFQELSRRIKRKYNIQEMAEELPVTVYLFDCIYHSNKNLLDTPYRTRWEETQAILKEEAQGIKLSHTIITDDPEEVRSFHAQAERDGQEGAMAKNLDAAYKPGSRVGYMVKLKHTMENLDLVIVEADWGEGERSDWLSSYTLACKNEDGGLETIGKMATGLTEEEFQAMTDRLKPLIEETEGRHVTLTPEVVVEVAFEEIQESPKYESGYALRFPRLVQVRDDLNLHGVDSTEKIEHLYQQQT